jgi:putative CocE/NonD family hydrolase
MVTGPRKALLPVRPPETASMMASDGTRLDADIYRPEAPGPYPVLLMRQPYGRRIASTVVYAHPSWYAAHGYIVVIQDVRGRGSSEGRFRLFADDVSDGGDAIAWAASLPHSNGRVGMYGFSYQGHTQLLALAAGRPELQALCPGMATWDVGAEWAYEGGAFSLANNVYWGVQMGAEQARLAGDAEAFDALRAASRALPLESSRPCRPEVLERFARYTHYQDWIDNPWPSPYWDSIAVGKALEGGSMDTPMLHFGGWFDFMLRGTLRIFHEAALRSARPQKLVVGPWAHMPWARHAGGVDFGPEAHGFVDALQIAWFDRFLGDVDNGVEAMPAVRLFDLVAKQWRQFHSWPRVEPRAFYTSSNGLAATSAAGRLTETILEPSIDAIVHDPWRPAPTSGGHNGQPGGMQDRAAIDERNDVLTYDTAPLASPLLLAGDVELVATVRSDQPSFDLSAVLSRVSSDGRAFNLTQGYRRIEAPAPSVVHVGMRALCATIPAGDALRLSLAGADFPAFPLNPGDGAQPANARAIDNQTITLIVRSGGDAPTHLELPVFEMTSGG